MPKMHLFPFAPSSLRTLPTGALLVTAAVLAGCANSRGLTPHAQTAPDASQLDALMDETAYSSFAATA